LKYVQRGDWLRMQIDCVFMRTFCCCRIHNEGGRVICPTNCRPRVTTQVAATAASNYFRIK
jgi:hypothetical protein